MKYVKEWKDGSGSEELTYDQARKLISDWYPADAVDDIIARPGTINCLVSYLIISET